MYNKDLLLHKVVRPGTIPVWEGGPRRSVFCEIEVTRDGVLSITGVIGPTRGGNATGGAGQIDMEFAHSNPAHDDPRYTNPIRVQDFNFAPGWTSDRWWKFLEVWHDWHLNDMKSNCIHQEARGETWTTHPSAVCPDCGWKLGHGWDKRELPGWVVEFLASLPDTDRTPAWV